MTTAEQLLQVRAADLARPLPAEDRTDRLRLLGLSVGTRAYAIDAAHIREVLASAHVSHLPWAPLGLIGVTNVRGRIVAVADLARLLDLPQSRADGPVVVLELDGHLLGLRVDEVDDITSIRADELRAIEGGAASRADLVLGCTATAVVLDARALFAPRRTQPVQETT